MPDHLYTRVRQRCAAQGTTLRTFIIACMEKELAEQGQPQSFRLRDASAGYSADAGEGVSSDAINAAIDAGRDAPFQP